MRYRQIHLDFHTSPVISDTGSQFDIDDFVKTLKNSNVNSINIFAKCHHGMCYYPTKEGVMHPALSFDLMGTMIKALHENDIECPIYFPLGWEEDSANRTEWLEIGDNGIPGGKEPFEAGYYTWRKLCLNNPEYKAHIKAQLLEIMENYEVDGFWFDIIHQNRCHCDVCIREMNEIGLDPASHVDLIRHDYQVLIKLQDELNDFIHSYNPAIKTVYNSSWAPDGGYDECTIEERAKRQDHVELESLPSGEWGYNHFPLFANFYNRSNEPLVGMNGKFHLSWGDHGSLKNEQALEYEAYRMIANGCACCVGDQLHPRGQMNKSAYKRIGKVFDVIKQLEPYLVDSTKCSDIGVVVSSDYFTKDSVSDEGAMRMLLELHYAFDFITVRDDLKKYKLVILPDSVPVNKAFSERLQEYTHLGGKVLATYKSTDKEALDVEYLQDNDYMPSYIILSDEVNEKLGTSIDPLEYVCYERGAYVKSSLPVISKIGDPYYNRTYDCFSSHRHFPYDKESSFPAILLGESIAYCVFPLFKDYIVNGNRVFREIIEGLIKKLLFAPIIVTDAPTCAETTVREVFGKTVVHLLCYLAQRNTKTIDIVDTRLPIHNVSLSLRADKDYKRAYLARSGASLPLSLEDGYYKVCVPIIDGYDIIVFE